jgi:hypothetical protein
MHIQKKIKVLSRLGEVMKSIGENAPWGGFDSGVTEEEYDLLNLWVTKAKVYNGWFEEREVRRAFTSWGAGLTEENLNKWLANYIIEDIDSPKTIAMIMAGNIPLVGLHDLICCYIAGHKALIKLSTDDDKLIPALLQVWSCFDVDVKDDVKLAFAKMENFDAVIATGSNNSARHFEEYFGKYPNIIRKNRTSVAVLDGSESEDELKALADDIFAYYGLGCRNVTKLYLPKGYDLNKVFGGLFHYKHVTDNNKYGNNYDYHKAVFLMEQYDVLENGFILVKQDTGLTSPIGTLFFDSYEDKNQLYASLDTISDQIQCIVGSDRIPFGQAQHPQLWDYADGVDTVQFLLDLN